ncbi:MAG TPA: pseudouridine synthase [Pyrinomonadaceae bacterium]|nr:pseudouridine synthase [Pyrinomonadaceae bacterium]
MEERLQKLIAAAGLASRRHAEEMIAAGEVTVNGKLVTEPGTKADPTRDHIKVRGKLINPLLETREKVYVLLNKPRGYLASLSDPEERPLVSELVPASLGRLHPVGRLDFNTEGLLILTNDGDLTNYVTAARNGVAKVYEVKVKGVPPEEAIERLRRGIRLDDGVHTAPAQITHAGETGTNAWFQVILHEGRNQQIRRMFDAIGHSVLKLRRTRIGDLQDERLPVGAYRLLSPEEVARLKPRAEKKRAAPTKSKTSVEGAARAASKTGAKGAAKSRGAGTGRRRS